MGMEEEVENGAEKESEWCHLKHSQSFLPHLYFSFPVRIVGNHRKEKQRKKGRRGYDGENKGGKD